MLKNAYIRVSGLALLILLLVFAVFKYLRNKETVLESYKFEKCLSQIPAIFKANDKLAIEIKKSKGCILKANVIWGTLVFSLDSALILPNSIVSEAGIHKLSIWCNSVKKEEKTFEVLPNESYGILLSYIGSKSIPADGGIHWSMLTVLPVDKYHNMIDDGSKITIKSTRPNGSYHEAEPITKNGIAYLKIKSQQNIGKTFLASSTSLSDSKEKELLELPNIPNSFSLFTNTKLLVADGRQYFKVTTSDILDKFGNRVSDGVLLRFIVVDQDGLQSIYRSFVMDGKASVNLKNPAKKGNIKVYAVVDNVLKSESISLNVQPYVSDFKLSFIAKKFALNIGPVLAKMGQYVSDGTEVKIYQNKKNNEYTTFLKDGVATFDLFKKSEIGDTLTVEIGGVSKEFIVL